MEQGRSYRASAEKGSDSKSEGDRKGTRRFTSVPRLVLTGEEQKPAAKRTSEAFGGSVVRLFAQPELPARPPAVELPVRPLTAELPQLDGEGKKKKKKKKKGEAATVEPAQDELATVIELPKDSDKEDDEEEKKERADEYRPIEIKLEKPEDADYRGEVIYLHNYVRSKAEPKDKEPTEASVADESEHVAGEIALQVADAESANSMSFHRQPEQQHMQAEVPPTGESEMPPEPEQPAVDPEQGAAQPAAESVPFWSPEGIGGGGGEAPPPGGGGGEMPPPGGGNGGGEEPPEFGNANNRVPQAAPLDWDPGRIYREYAERDAEARTTSVSGGVSPTEQVITKQEHDNALYRAEKTGQNRGVAAGLVVGWWLGRRFLRKKMTRQFATTTNEQNKKIQQTETTLHFSQEEQAKQRSELERQRAELNRYQAASQQFAERYHTAPGGREAMPQQQAAQGREQLQPNRTTQELQPQNEDQLKIPPEHVVQSSAWHNIEIDARTGRAVEAPSFQYGEEYHRERAAETMPTNQQGTVAGEGASMAVASASSHPGTNGSTDNAGPSNASGPVNQSGTPTLPPTNIPSATTQGPPIPRTERSSSGPIWPYLIALVVIVLCLVWLLH